MCPKHSKAPVFLIGGVCFVIILVAICGITLINNINLSNIIRLNEKVASDSMSTNHHNNEMLEDFQRPEHDNRPGDKDFSNYEQNHPKNIYRFDKETGMMSNVDSNSHKPHNFNHNDKKPPLTTTPTTAGNADGVKANFQQPSANAHDSAVTSFWQNGKILTNDRNIDALQIQETNGLISPSSGAATTTTTSTQITNVFPSMDKVKDSSSLSTSASATTAVMNNDLLQQVLEATSESATPSGSLSPSVLVISDKNISLIDYEKRSHIVEVSARLCSRFVFLIGHVISL